MKKFLDYIQAGSIEKISKVLEKGLDPNYHDPDTGGEFHSSLGGSLGQTPTFTTFLTAPVERSGLLFINRYLSRGSLSLSLSLHPLQPPESPLSVAMQSALSVEGIRILVLGGAHVDFRTRDGLTAIHKAVIAHNHAGLLVTTTLFPTLTRSVSIHTQAHTHTHTYTHTFCTHMH